jgi:hypothetical protein
MPLRVNNAKNKYINIFAKKNTWKTQPFDDVDKFGENIYNVGFFGDMDICWGERWTTSPLSLCP